jgi:hypothetical protein
MGTDLTLVKDRAFYALDTLKESWLLTAKRFFPLFLSWALSLGFPVALIIFGGIAGGIADHMAGSRTAGFFTLIGLLIPGALIGWMWAGWNLICLKVARGIDTRMSDLIRPLPQILSAFVVLVISTICIGALSWLVIPGALLFLKWQLAPFYIVDRNYGPFQAMKASWHDTDRVFIPLALLDLAFVGLSMASTPLIFGPILCTLAMGVASAIVYNAWLADESHPDLKTQLEEIHNQWIGNQPPASTSKLVDKEKP